MQYCVGELVVAVEAATQPAAPSRDAAAGVELEGRFATVERGRDVVPSHLQQGRSLECSIAAAAERLLKPGGDLGCSEVPVGRCHDERGARQNAQDLGHALARLQDRDAADREMAVIGDAVTFSGEVG